MEAARGDKLSWRKGPWEPGGGSGVNGDKDSMFCLGGELCNSKG